MPAAKGAWTVATEKTPAESVVGVPVTMTMDQLQLLLQSVQGAGVKPEDIKAILAQQAESTKELVQASRPMRHSNPAHEHKSAFSHPEGDVKRPKARLTRETYMNNHRESEDDLTPFEIDAYNAIQHPCEARDGTWTVRFNRNRMFIDVPSFTQDDRMNLPNGLVLILRELSHGAKAADPSEMLLRIAALEAQIAQNSSVVLA
jgi:hypothetical protein